MFKDKEFNHCQWVIFAIIMYILFITGITIVWAVGLIFFFKSIDPEYSVIVLIIALSIVLLSSCAMICITVATIQFFKMNQILKMNQNSPSLDLDKELIKDGIKAVLNRPNDQKPYIHKISGEIKIKKIK